MRHALLVSIMAVATIPKGRSRLLPVATRTVAHTVLGWLDRRRHFIDGRPLE